MSLINANDLRSKDVIFFEEKIWKVVGLPEHIKPGKGPAYIQTTLRNMENGAKIQRRFKSTVSFEKAYIETNKLQYLYSHDDESFFMNPENFEQISILNKSLGEKVHLLQENMEIFAEIFESKIIDILLPDTLEVEILDTEPYLKGATATNSFKKATIKGNITISIPHYLEKGTKVIIKSSSYEFVKKVL